LLPASDVLLWLSKSTFEAGTVLGTLMLVGMYLTVALLLATVLRIAVMPSKSMEPALMPRDVVLVMRSTLFCPRVNNVVFFDPPKELDNAIANFNIGRAVTVEVAAAVTDTMDPSSGLTAGRPKQFTIMSTKGKQFLKRVVGIPGDRVSITNANLYVTL
jgi:signal peptidase I